MTPEERAVIQAAISLEYAVSSGVDPVPFDEELRLTVRSLVHSCPQCNQGGHTCPGDGNSIEHGETDCGQHDEPAPGWAQGPGQVRPGEADYPTAAPEWLPATFRECLAGDRIRLGQEETVVTFSSIGTWHTNGEWSPKAWTHEELVLDLEANPGRRNYPPNTPIEILCDATRAAMLGLQGQFPGTKEV